MLKILLDKNIIHGEKLFSSTGKVIKFSNRSIAEFDLTNIDALIIRSVTKINFPLIKGKSIKFIGSVTSGIDHIDDEQLLIKSGIKFVSAPGCNAISVAEYVFCALFFLAENNGFQLSERIVGIVGVGNVGKYLQKILNFYGIKTLLCDPPRNDREHKKNFLSLELLVKNADIITLHTPLNIYSPYKTLHLINKSLLLKLKKNSILINTCRGSVVDNIELLEVLKLRPDIKIIMDVWEFEPNILISLLENVDIATAHIAGNTLEAKTKGVLKIFKDWCYFIGKSQKINLKDFLPSPKFNEIKFNGILDQKKLKQLLSLVYNIYQDDIALRKILSKIITFDQIRNSNSKRREFSSLKIICDNKQTAITLNNLGFKSQWKN